MTTRPPGARLCGNTRSSASSAENSPFTAMRSAWNVRRTDILTSLLASVGCALMSPARTELHRVRRIDGLLLQQRGNEPGMRFIRVLGEERGELLLAQARHELRCGLTVRRVHPHVERAVAP